LTPVPLAPGEEYGAGAGAGAPVEDIDTQLRRLAKMREDGLVTDEEYEEKRQKLVSRL
jgi:hypothetical protein